MVDLSASTLSAAFEAGAGAHHATGEVGDGHHCDDRHCLERRSVLSVATGRNSNVWPSHIRELTYRCCCRRAERATAACSPVRGHHRLVDCGPDRPRLSSTTNPDAVRRGIWTNRETHYRTLEARALVIICTMGQADALYLCFRARPLCNVGPAPTAVAHSAPIQPAPQTMTQTLLPPPD